MKPEIQRVFHANYGVYGARKIHAQLRREGVSVARCTVERLMRQMGPQGLRRGLRPRTTVTDGAALTATDLVERSFTAAGPNRLWVADITYIRTFSGWVYAAYVLDVYSRMVVGWQASTSLHTNLALDALEMGIWARKRAGHDVTGLVHHSDRGVQYRAIRYTERLAEADLVASVGSRGDSYDNAMAEAFNSLVKGELIHNPVSRGRGWYSIRDVEIAVAEYVDGYNYRRVHGQLGQHTPAEIESVYQAAGYDQTIEPARARWQGTTPASNPGRISLLVSQPSAGWLVLAGIVIRFVWLRLRSEKARSEMEVVAGGVIAGDALFSFGESTLKSLTGKS